MKKIIILIAILLLSLTAVNVWVSQNTPPQSEQVLPVQADEDRLPPPDIGGGFTLTDHDGKTVKDTDYRGRVMLVFFGFTHCPDICPLTSRTLSEVMTGLADQAGQVAPLFITVDPARDTPQVLKTYFANVDKRITGLTGTPEQVKAVAEVYKAYYSKAEPEEELPAEDDAEAHHPDGHGAHGSDHHGGDYNVNHSGYVYLMGKDGVYVKHFPYDVPAADVIAAVRQYLQQHP
jgi:protein SCO1